MAPLVESDIGPVFVGEVDDAADLLAAALMAAPCAAFARDDDDECYVDGPAPTCFNCRGHRWV